MNQLRSDARTHYVVLQVSLDPGRDVARVRVEQRDFQFRLVSRADLIPLLRGGTPRTITEGVELLYTLVADNLLTDTATLRGEDSLDLEREDG